MFFAISNKNVDWSLSGEKQCNTLFLCLYPDKTWVFDQSEHTQGPIYIIKIGPQRVFVSLCLVLFHSVGVCF